MLTIAPGFQVDQKTLQQKNVELVEMYREKSKKQAQTQHLYDTLKKRVMTSQVQTAASDSVAKAIGSMSNVSRPQTYEDTSLQQASVAQSTTFRSNDFANTISNLATAKVQVGQAGMHMEDLETSRCRHPQAP
jgi:hypothetical protein